MKRVGAPASRQHVTHSDWDSCVSDPPHGCVGGFVSGPAPASQAPAWHPPRSVVPPTQRAEVSAAGICVCAWLQRLAVCQPAARHVHCRGAAGRAGVRTGSEPWPWGRQNSREELQASEPKYPAAGPLPRTGHQHTLQAVMPWPGCAGTTLALHVAEGVKKLCRPPLWPNSERKTRRFLHSLDREGPGVGEGPGRRTDLGCVAALGQRAGAGAVPLLLPHSSWMRAVGGGPMEALGQWLTESLSHRPGLCGCPLLEYLSNWG